MLPWPAYRFAKGQAGNPFAMKSKRTCSHVEVFGCVQRKCISSRARCSLGIHRLRMPSHKPTLWMTVFSFRNYPSLRGSVPTGRNMLTRPAYRFAKGQTGNPFAMKSKRTCSHVEVFGCVQRKCVSSRARCSLGIHR